MGGVALLGTAVGSAHAQDGGSIGFEEWFSNVGNYDGVVDATGESSVAVTVGAEGNGGGFAFDPPAVRVDPGTTVTWEWSGEGGSHDVAAEDGAYGSDLLGDAGATFEHAFDAAGISYYACTPHKSMGMKAAVVVGDERVGTTSSSAPEPDYGSWFDGVPNFEGTADARGDEHVRVAVGETAAGEFVFDPAAVRIDPGTTVVWEWVGGDAAHTVTARDGSYGSEAKTEAGSGYALTFDGDGISKYGCDNNETMRGALVVGDGGREVTSVTPLGTVLGGGLAAAILGFLGIGLYYHIEDTTTHVAAEPSSDIASPARPVQDADARRPPR